MKRKLISILLCLHMTALLFSGCKKEADPEATPTEETVTENTEGTVEIEEPAVLVENMTPEGHLNYVFIKYSNLSQKGYTAYRGKNWDEILLDELVRIDTSNQLVNIEKFEGDNPEANNYYLTNEGGVDYLYIPDVSSPDSYVKTTGNETLSYSKYIASMTIPSSTAEYEIADLSIKVDEPHQNSQGINVQELVLFYTKKLVTAEGNTVEMDVTDIITVNADTQDLIMRAIEIEDRADETSAYNSVEEIHFTTGDEATSLDNCLPAHVYSMTAIPYEEYVK